MWVTASANLVIAAGTVWWYWVLLVLLIVGGLIRLLIRPPREWFQPSRAVAQTPRWFFAAIGTLILIGVVWLLVQDLT
jgi:hypothetical protein